MIFPSTVHMPRRGLPEVVCAMVQIGHHPIVYGQEGKVAPAGRLHHTEDVQRARAALADGKCCSLGSPQATIGRQSVPAAAGNQAKGRLDALAPVIPMEVPLSPRVI